MTQFSGRFERGLPNTAGRRPRGLRSIAGSTIGTAAPDTTPRVGVAGTAPDRTAGSLAEILNRGSQVAAQSLAVYNRNRELADQQLLGRGSEIAEDALPEIEARIAGLDAEGLEQFDIDDEVASQLGDSASPALRRGFRERANLSLSRAVQQRRTFLDQTARRDATEDIVAGLATADQDDDPDQRLADATIAFFRANPDATDADFARSVLPVVREAAVSGNRRLFNLLGGVVETSLPEDFGRASRTIAAVEDDRAIADERRLVAEIQREAARVRLGERSQDSFLDEFGGVLGSRPTLNEDIRNSFTETGNLELERARNRLRASANAARDDYLERRRSLLERDDPDGKNEELVSRLDKQFQDGLAERARRQAGRVESDVGRLIEAGQFGLASSLVSSAADRQIFGDTERDRLLTRVEREATTRNLTASDATTLADPSRPGNAATFTAFERELPDGSTLRVTGQDRARNAYNAVLADAFGPGRSPLREYIAGGDVPESAIEQNIALAVNSGHQPENLVAEINGAMASASDSAPSQPQEVLRAVDVARRLKARGLSVIESGTNGQILRHSLALAESGVARSDAEAVAMARSAVTRIGTGEIDDYVQRVSIDDVEEALPRDLRDDAYAKNTIGDAVWQYQTFLQMDQESALRAATEQFRLDHTEVGGKWINTTRMQLDDASIGIGSRLLRLYAESRGIEEPDAHVDNRTGLMYIPRGGPDLPTLDSEDIRFLNQYANRLDAYENLRRLAESRGELDRFGRDYLLDPNEIGPYRSGLGPVLDWIRSNREAVVSRPRGMSFGEAVGGSLAGRSPV